MLEIKVLFWVRQDFYTHPGGDSTQALSMLNALRGMSIDVEISQDINISLKKFTHVFIWHLTRIQDSWYYCRKAKDAGKKLFWWIPIGPCLQSSPSFLGVALRSFISKPACVFL